MSSAPTAPPPPTTRSLSVVLRDALEKGEEVRLIIAKALADSGQNAAAYVNVEIEGLTVTIPKLGNSGIGGTGSGYPVYVLAAKDFMLAVGTVKGTTSSGGPLTVPALTVVGAASVGTTLSVGGTATVGGLQCNGNANVTGSINTGGVAATGNIQAARLIATGGIDARAGAIGFFGATPTGKFTCSEKYGFDGNTCLTADNIARILREMGLINY